MQRARAWHTVTAVAAIVALLLVLVLVIQSHRVLEEARQPGLGLRLGRQFSYFTIQSNILVAVTAVQLARSPARDGSTWRVLRLAAVIGIAVTGVVHFFLIRPFLDLSGVDFVTDKLLHMVVPGLAVVGWALFGPRPRVDWRAVRQALCWPVAWLAWTLAVGGLVGWYPYAFLDHREPDGATGVVVTSVGITLFFLLLFWLAKLYDQRAKVAP